MPSCLEHHEAVEENGCSVLDVMFSFRKSLVPKSIDQQTLVKPQDWASENSTNVAFLLVLEWAGAPYN
jgi:hypothetical protein